MAAHVNISTARKTLPTLFDRVTARDGEKVAIRRRDGGAEAVLVSRDYLDLLERARAAPPPAAPFCLLGSGTLVPGGDGAREPIEAVRYEDARSLDRRMSSLAAAPKPRPAARRTRPRKAR